jgi:hypothetical protein
MEFTAEKAVTVIFMPEKEGSKTVRHHINHKRRQQTTVQDILNPTSTLLPHRV